MSLKYNYFSLKGCTENGKLLMSVTIKNGKLICTEQQVPTGAFMCINSYLELISILV